MPERFEQTEGGVYSAETMKAIEEELLANTLKKYPEVVNEVEEYGELSG